MLPGDLDFAAIDDLLGLTPQDAWATVLDVLAGNIPQELEVEIAEDVAAEESVSYDLLLNSDDPTTQALIDRIYAPRRVREAMSPPPPTDPS